MAFGALADSLILLKTYINFLVIRNKLESNGLRKTGRESETSERVERREESERLGGRRERETEQRCCSQRTRY